MPSTGAWDDICAIAVVPVAVWLIACGFGLLIERVARVRLPNPLLIALGFCASILVALGTYTTGAGNAVALPVVVVLTVAGFALAGRRGLLRLNAGWPLLAAIGAYLLFNASVIMSGHWTFTAYNLENDSAYELLLVAHLQAHGTQALGLHAPISTANTALSAYLSSGYPLGSQSLLAVVSGLLGVSAAGAWQSFISTMAAIGALACSTLAGRTMDRRLAALMGFVAVSAALTYQYALDGAIKEIAVVAVVLCALAVIRHAVLTLSPIVGVVLSAIPVGAILAVYSAAGAPYAASVAGAGVLAIPFVHRGKARLRGAGRPATIGVAALAVCALPAMPSFTTFLHVANTGFTGADPAAPALGPLLRPLPLSEISGVWLFGDYRLAVPGGTKGLLTVVATVLIFALIAPAILRAVAAREPGPLMGLLVTALVLVVVFPRVTPYAQAKLLAIASPFVVLAAAQGLTGFRGHDWRALCGVAAAAIGITVIASDAFAYHDFPVAPTPRLVALQQVGQRLGNRGPVLDSEFDQFAKYFGLPAQIVDGPDAPTPIGLALRQPTDEWDRSFDLDEEQFTFVESFPYVLTPPGPASSRPPSNFRLMYRNDFYDLWRRTSTPQVRAHMPLSGEISSAGQVRCAALRDFVKGAKPTERLAVAIPPPAYGYNVADAAVRSAGWIAAPNLQNEFYTTTPGEAERMVRLPETTTYRMWVKGDLPRSVSVTVNGRSVGSATGADTPGGWLEAGSVRLSAGSYKVGVVRPGGGLGPGNGSMQASIGAVALVAGQQPEQVKTVPLRSWRSLCGARADWVELVQP
jgi:hypothetical protein